jgi:hypothetical protein
LPKPLTTFQRNAILGTIQTYSSCGTFYSLVSRSTVGGEHLCIKYLHPAAARYYRKPGGRLAISSNPAFTWGPATYVTPLAYPYSSAVFGRLGIVSSFDPTNWKVLDMTTPPGQDAFLTWFSHQPRARWSHLTMHSAILNGNLKAAFRREFEIDCILFSPDQINHEYTHRDDVWMAVTDWAKGRIEVRSSGFSHNFNNPKISVLLEEEFRDRRYGMERQQLLRLSSIGKPKVSTIEVGDAYLTDQIVRIPA